MFKREDLNSWISVGVSFIALLVTILAFARQLSFESNYNGNARQVMINSIDLAVGDMDRLYSRIDELGDTVVSVENLKIEQDSLEENLNVIQQVDATSIPKKQSLNYQFYRQELNRCVIAIKDGISFAKNTSDSMSPKEKEKYHVKNGWVHVDSVSKQVIKNNVKIEISSLQSIRKFLANNEQLSNQKIQDANKLVEGK